MVYSSQLFLQLTSIIASCALKYPTISSYFRVTLPIFGTEVSKKICSIKPKNTKLILLLINDPIIGSKNLLKISSDFKANIILNIWSNHWQLGDKKWFQSSNVLIMTTKNPESTDLWTKHDCFWRKHCDLLFYKWKSYFRALFTSKNITKDI